MTNGHFHIATNTETEKFYHLWKFSWAPLQLTPLSSTLSSLVSIPRQTLVNVPSPHISLSSSKMKCKWIIQYKFSCLASLAQHNIFWDLYMLSYVTVVFLYCWILFHWWICLPIHVLKDIWVLFTLGTLERNKAAFFRKSFCKHRFSFLLGKIEWNCWV